MLHTKKGRQLLSALIKNPVGHSGRTVHRTYPLGSDHVESSMKSQLLTKKQEQTDKSHQQTSAKKVNSKEALSAKAVEILAHSIYQNLKDEGYAHKDIIGVSSQLIGLVTSAIQNKRSS